jgi:hypothetical protein
MKKLIGIATAALLVLVSCQVPFTGAGAVRISLANASSSSGGKSLNQGDPVRIQLVRNNAIIPQSGQDYQEVKFASQTVTIDQLSPGTGYKVLVAGGSYDNGFFVAKNFGQSKDFEVTAGVESAVGVTADLSELTVLSAGSQGAAAVVGGKLDYLSGGSIKEFGNSTPLLNSTSGLTIRSFSTGLNNKLYATDLTTPASNLVLSNFADEQLWVNTSQGIAVFDGTSLSTPTITHEAGTADTHPDVAFSGSIAIINDADITLSDSSVIKHDNKAYFLHLYGGAGTSAGARFETSSDTAADHANPVWYSVDDKISNLPSSVTDILNKSGNLFLGYAKADNYALIASSMGVYRVTKTMIMDGKNKSLAYFDSAYPLSDPQDANHYKVLLGLADRDAKSQGVASSATGATSSDKAYVYVAANRGLFLAGIDPSTGKLSSGLATTYTIQYTDTDADGNAKYHWIDADGVEVPATNTTLLATLGTATKGGSQTVGTVTYTTSERRSYTIPSAAPDYLAQVVPGTERKNFGKVVSTAVDGNVYAAAYASDSREIWILKNDQVIKSIPIFAGLPSGSLDLVWFPKVSGQAVNGNTLELVVSGSDGIVAYDYKY